MTPLPFVWPFAAVFWAIFVWAYAAESRIVRNATRQAGPSDRNSLNVILIGQGLAFFFGFWFAWQPSLQFHAHRRLVFAIGIAMIIGGALLRRHCFRMLRHSFTGDVRAASDQEVVDRGAYRFVRHPSYTAGILLNTGVGVALGSWASALLIAAASTAVYIHRMNVEERELLAGIGEPYADFMRTRRRLVPWVY